MRKIFFLVFAGGIILAGCSKNSDSLPTNIVGTWNADKLILLTYKNDTLIAGDTATTGTLVFKSDGTFSSTDSTGTENGMYIYNSSTHALSIIEGTDTSNADVTNLTSHNLHLTDTDTEEFNGDHYKAVSDYDYTR